MAYERVNQTWPAGTNDGRDLKPTAQEAVAACRRLYRFAMKKPFKGIVRATSGNRRGGFTTETDPRNKYRVISVIEVNPDRWGGGWHEVVHMMSHYCAWRLHPGAKSHGPQHHWVELQMVEHVVKSGWLDGKLKRPEKVKAPVDRVAKNRERVLARIKRWETKRKRAETALRKLRRSARRYEAQPSA
jgi:hypothetical protein